MNQVFESWFIYIIGGNHAMVWYVYSLPVSLRVYFLLVSHSMSHLLSAHGWKLEQYSCRHVYLIEASLFGWIYLVSAFWCWSIIFEFLTDYNSCFLHDTNRRRCSLSFPRRVFIPWLAGTYICDYLQAAETLEVCLHYFDKSKIKLKKSSCCFVLRK